MDQSNILYTVIAIILFVQCLLFYLLFFRVRMLFMDVEYLKKLVSILEKKND